MYFEEDKINNALECEKCQKKLIKPTILPCGYTVCLSCIQIVDEKNKAFTCDLCSNEHIIPQNGFPINKVVEKLLAIEAQKMTKYEAIESLKILMKQIEDIIISFRTGIDKTVDYIKEYGLKLKMNAQLAAEEMIMEINEKNELIMNKIDNYIDKAIESFVPINDSSKNEFLKTLQELECYQTEWLNNLNNNNKNFDTLLEATNKAKILIRTSYEHQKKLDKLIFNDKVMIYEKQQNIDLMADNALICKKFCSLILSETEMNKLLTFLGLNGVNLKLSLELRDTFGDSFDVGLPKSGFFIIFKSNDGKIFGGYYRHHYNNEYHDGYLFNLANANKPVKCSEEKPKSLTLCKILQICREFSLNFFSKIEQIEIFTNF